MNPRPSNVFFRLFALLLPLIPALSWAGEPEAQKLPKLLLGENVTLFFTPDYKPAKSDELKGFQAINVEPGCIIMYGKCHRIDGNHLSIEMLHDNASTKRAMEAMGVTSETVIIQFVPPTPPGTGAKIVSITPSKSGSDAARTGN